MKTFLPLLACVLGTSSAFAPSLSRNAASSLKVADMDNAVGVSVETGGNDMDNAVGVSVETVGNDMDNAFGVSVETGGKCTPLGKALLQDSKPEALKWFQNAEIKHGRIAMVAIIGFWVQKSGVHFPLYLGPTGSNAFNPASDEAWFLSKSAGVTFSDLAAAAPMDAIKMIPIAGWVQIFFVAAWFECVAINRQYTPGFEDAIPGNYGYDPLGFTKREGGFESEEIKSLRMKEIKNGRVAMMAIAGWVSNEMIPGAFPLWHP
jgi:hypothetical protein